MPDEPELSGEQEIPAGSLDFLKRAPTFITAQAYRESMIDGSELRILKAHLDCWRQLLFKHGVIYDGILVDGLSSTYKQLIYHVAMAIDGATYPAALPLVLDALFDLTNELPALDWQIYGVEQVVTRFEPELTSKSLLAGERLFAQHFHGRPAGEESSGPF
jgi:hypothetical protein